MTGNLLVLEDDLAQLCLTDESMYDIALKEALSMDLTEYESDVRARPSSGAKRTLNMCLDKGRAVGSVHLHLKLNVLILVLLMNRNYL